MRQEYVFFLIFSKGFCWFEILFISSEIFNYNCLFSGDFNASVLMVSSGIQTSVLVLFG